ncbi:hypothetical protein [Halomonas sp. E14]|uniref:hypothetical protein n=1 Tax=Halomonas sp. E14 TaxID=3397245 RepID=UPI00403EAA56
MTTRLEQLAQNDPSLTPLLAHIVTEFCRRAANRTGLDNARPRRPIELHPDTRLALALCAEGWSLEDVEQHLAARTKLDSQELSSRGPVNFSDPCGEPVPGGISRNQNPWLAEACDDMKSGAMPSKEVGTSHVVYLALTGTRIEALAPTWQEALLHTGRSDACCVEQTDKRTLQVTFDPESPQIIDYHLRCGNYNDALRDVLSHVLLNLDASARSGGES